MQTCPLCLSPQRVSVASHLWTCTTCFLAYKETSLHLTPSEEERRYRLHTNHIDDEAYVNFLKPALQEVLARKNATAKGLDYGSGPTAVLKELFARETYEVIAYDPLFSPVDFSLLQKLDFITCTESAEHFASPAKEFEHMFSLLKSDGVLVLMTALYNDQTSWNTWWYAKDPTHICFYSEKTFKWIAQKFSANLELISSRLAVFSLKESSSEVLLS